MIDAAREIRKLDPGIGGYKLWLIIKSMFAEDWTPGRDKFFAMLGAYGLGLPRPKPRHTTNSNHRYHKYKNLIIGFVPTAANQLWVSDITYIDLEYGCCYLHLVTDAYSHKIIGWCLSETLEAKYTIKALMMAIEQTGKTDLNGLIHHSDRGSQYCCNAYVGLLQEYNISISMTEDYNPTDNAIAERVNGIIKQEVVYREKCFKNRQQAYERLDTFITFYNDRRPHMSLGYQTPSQAHSQVGEQQRVWKKKVDKSCSNEENVVPLQCQKTVSAMDYATV